MGPSTCRARPPDFSKSIKICSKLEAVQSTVTYFQDAKPLHAQTTAMDNPYLIPATRQMFCQMSRSGLKLKQGGSLYCRYVGKSGIMSGSKPMTNHFFLLSHPYAVSLTDFSYG